jgi:hypothetical protein
MLLAFVLIGYFANNTHLPIIRFISIMTLAFFSFYLIMNAKRSGFAAGFCVLLGCSIVISGILITTETNYIEKHSPKYNLFVQTIDEKIRNAKSYSDAIHLYGLVTGISSIGLGLIFAYRPTLIQTKNYLPFEYPYPIWGQKDQPVTQFSRNLVSASTFLTEKEKMLVCRFRYLLVSINGKMYLVSPDEKIPDDSVIVRTKTGKTLCGISRF